MEYLGHVPNLSNEAYHLSEGVSASGLIKLIQQTPKHYKAYLERIMEPTAAMKMGTAIHMAVLEADVFKETYVQKPEGLSFATKEGKAWREENKDKEMLSYEEFEACRGIWKSVNGNSRAKELLSGGHAEQSYFWKDPETGLLSKCRPDYLSGNKIIDIKTTEHAYPAAFQRSINKYRLDLQATWYMRGMSAFLNTDVTLEYIVIEKTPPYAIAFYSLGRESLIRAENEILVGMQRLKECMDSNEWPGYGLEPQEIESQYFGL